MDSDIRENVESARGEIKKSYMTQSTVQNSRVSKVALWSGRIISALPALLLLMSGTMKLIKPAFVVEGFTHLGWPERDVVGIGLMEIACVAVYVIPRTSVLGAILMTG